MLSQQKYCCLASSVLDWQKHCCLESDELDDSHNPTPGINAIIFCAAPTLPQGSSGTRQAGLLRPQRPQVYWTAENVLADWVQAGAMSGQDAQMDDVEEESAAGPEALAAVQASLCPTSFLPQTRCMRDSQASVLVVLHCIGCSIGCVQCCLSAHMLQLITCMLLEAAAVYCPDVPLRFAHRLPERLAADLGTSCTTGWADVPWKP